MSKENITLIHALREADYDSAKTALLRGDESNISDENGMTPLMWAIQWGYSDLVKILVGSQLNIHTKNSDGVSALDLAVLSCDYISTKLIVAAGADTNVEDERGRNFLINSVIIGQKDLVDIFLAVGLDVDHKDINGWTALMYASYYNRDKIVRSIIEADANLRIRNNDGKTAFDIAEYRGFDNIKELTIP